MDVKTSCCNCGAEIDLSVPGWYETDDGDLCPSCAEQMFDASLDDLVTEEDVA